MFKVAVLINRNPALSIQQFRDYYEAVHAPLAAGFMPRLTRYTRHFIRPFGNGVYDAGESTSPDVITEMWFANESDFQDTMKDLSSPEIAAALGSDEEKLFDRNSIRIVIMEDRGDPIY